MPTDMLRRFGSLCPFSSSSPARRTPRPLRVVVALVIASLGLASGPGCRSHQSAKVLQPGDKEMIGSHKAGQEVYRPLVEQTVASLLGQFEQSSHMQLASAGGEPLPPPRASVCFVGVENKTSEEIGDFKEMLFEMIDSKLLESPQFKPISRRYVQAGLDELRVPPQQLFVPANMQSFVHVMQQSGHPFEYLMFAKLTSGTTQDNRNYQRDYQLTLEMVDIRTGEQHKQSTPISKAYYHSWSSRVMSNIWPK